MYPAWSLKQSLSDSCSSRTRKTPASQDPLFDMLGYATLLSWKVLFRFTYWIEEKADRGCAERTVAKSKGKGWGRHVVVDNVFGHEVVANGRKEWGVGHRKSWEPWALENVVAVWIGGEQQWKWNNGTVKAVQEYGTHVCAKKVCLNQPRVRETMKTGLWMSQGCG